jgi:phosphoserine phosphatase
MHSKQRALDALARHLGLYGRGAKTIAAAMDGEKRDANAILRERLLKIARRDGTGVPEEKKKKKQ